MKPNWKARNHHCLVVYGLCHRFTHAPLWKRIELFAYATELFMGVYS